MKTPLLARHNTLRTPVFAAVLPFFVLFLAIQSTQAGSATWSSSPPDNQWGDSADWAPQTVPDSGTDTATFGTSAVTTLYMNSNDGVIAVGELDFSPGASAFNITSQGGSGLNFQGAGIVNASGITQNFIGEGFPDSVTYSFLYEASAGSQNFFSLPGGTAGDNGYIGFLYFFNSSNAGSSSFLLGGGVGRNKNGALGYFLDTSTMSAATITVAGGSQTGNGASLTFYGNSSAGQGTLIVNGGRNGTGGTVFFSDTSSGGTAQLQLSGNGSLDISGHSAPGLTIGSIAGSGAIHLGANSLTVGGGNLNTAFAGTIDGAGGSIVKDGNRMLTLTNANTYTGGTIIDSGTLSVRNQTGSATGTGSVQVNHGTFAGTGAISGPVTVASSAVLAPGLGKTIGTLSLLGGMTFNSHSTCLVELKSTTATTDKVAAFGVTILSGARISIGDLGTTSLPSGTILTVISNTGATPITGIFGNLPDNSTVTVGSNNYQVSYEGGDGNDLTLMVVP